MLVRGDDGVCQKTNANGWYLGVAAVAYNPDRDNGGVPFTWQECASYCAQRSSCRTWALQLEGTKECHLKDNVGAFNADPDHEAGLQDSDCVSTDYSVCQKTNVNGWYAGHVAVAYIPNRDNGGVPFTWQECASYCAQRSTCITWALQLEGAKECHLKDTGGTFIAGPAQTGLRDLDCATVDYSDVPSSIPSSKRK